MAICQSEQLCCYQECSRAGTTWEFGRYWLECILGAGTGEEVRRGRELHIEDKRAPAMWVCGAFCKPIEIWVSDEFRVIHQ